MKKYLWTIAKIVIVTILLTISLKILCYPIYEVLTDAYIRDTEWYVYVPMQIFMWIAEFILITLPCWNIAVDILDLDEEDKDSLGIHP